MAILTAPEHPFNQMARQANKLLDHLQKGFYVYSDETWTPNVNLYETTVSYLVCVDLAGVNKQKIDVEIVDQQRLRLRGTRAVPSFDEFVPPAPSTGSGQVLSTGSGQALSTGSGQAPQPGGEGQPPGPDADPGQKRVRIHLMEIDHGAFSREVELPLGVNQENISANYRDGMLWIEIPKA